MTASIFAAARKASGGGAPTLNALSLSNTSPTQNVPVTINIIGTTLGSTITVQTGTLPTGLTLNSAARTITGTPTTTTSSNFTLRETLTGATNTPRDTALNITPAALVPADFLVVDDSTWAAANTAATAGQIIQLQDSGTFTDLVLTNNTGVIVRPQTRRVPTVRTFAVRGATNAQVSGLKIRPTVAIVASVPALTVNDTTGTVHTCQGLVIDDMDIFCGNSFNANAPFDPTFYDTSIYGGSGTFSSTNFMNQVYSGIGVAGGAGITVPSGDITISNCTITDGVHGIKLSYGGGKIKLLGNSIGRIYADPIAIIMNIGAAAIDGSEVCGNEVYDCFSQPQDNVNPHSDATQWAGNAGGAGYNNPIRNVLVAGNVWWFHGGARGEPQRFFFSDTKVGFPYQGCMWFDNLAISRITGKALEVDSGGGGGSAWTYSRNNTYLSNPSNNAPIQNELLTNPVSGATPASSTASATINLKQEPSYFNAQNWSINDVTEALLNNSGMVAVGTIITGRGSNATSYGTYANPATDPAWNALASADDYYTAFKTAATYSAGKGAGVLAAAATATALRNTWKTPGTRPWASIPTITGWQPTTGAPLSTSTDSGPALVHIPGGGSKTATPVAGTQYAITNAPTDTPAYGTTPASVTDKQFLWLRKTSSASNGTEVFGGITVGSDLFQWSLTTLSVYPTVNFSGSRFVTSTPALGTDGRYLTVSFEMQFPSGAPATQVTIWGGVTTGGASGGVVSVVLMTSGALRIFVQNAAGTIISQMTSTISGATLCDGGIHVVQIAMDMEQATAAVGRFLYIDGVDRTLGTGTWGGGTGVTVGYSRTTSLAGYSIGGVAASMITGNFRYFYLDILSMSDITNATVRNKFLAAQIGSNGSGPSGAQPHSFMTGIDTQWNAGGGINWGYGPKYISAGTGVTAVSGSSWP